MTPQARRRQQRALLIVVCGVVVAIATALILFAMSSQITFNRTPTQIAAGEVQPGTKIRIGGLVEQGSVQRDGDVVNFSITDGVNRVPATYDDILPDLFREGQGVVAEGALDASGLFVAERVLARHDENYIPKEVADALKEQGVWRGDGTPIN